MKTNLTRKGLCIAFLAAMVLLFALASPALAYLYRATFTVANNSSTDYTALPVSCSAPVVWLINNGFIPTATALDTRVETFGGVDQLHMMAEDRIMAFAPTLDGTSQLNWYLSTGNTPLAGFPVITGYGGYVTTADTATLEPANNFSIEFEGWVDSSLNTFPVIESVTNSTESVITATHNVSLPSGIEVGDLLIILFDAGDLVANNPTITWPAGWTQLDVYVDTDYAAGAAYKVATGSEGSAVFVITSQAKYSVHQSYRISNYQSTPVITAEATGAGSPNPPSLTPSWGNKFGTLWLPFCAGMTQDADDVTAAPTNYEDLAFIEYSTHPRLASAKRSYVKSPEDPGAFTSGGFTYAAWTIGIQGHNPFVTKQDAVIVYTNGTDVVASILGGTIKTVTATSISATEHKVEVWANTSDLCLEIDDVVEDTEALGGISVPANANDWILSASYFNYYKHYVNGVLIAWYQPITLISGTTLPDRQGADQNGVITWGTNPTGVSVTLGSLAAEPTSVATDDDDDDYRDTLPTAESSDWFTEPDISVKLAANPLRPLVAIMSDTTTLTEVQAWRFLGLAILLLITVSAAVLVHGHLLIAGLACGGVIAVLVQQTIWPGWTLVFMLPAIIAGLMAERTPSIG